MDKIVKTDAEWQAQLSDLAFKVTRKHGTERAFTHDDFPKEPWHLPLHLLRCAPVRSEDQVRLRHRLAQLLRPPRP